MAERNGVDIGAVYELLHTFMKETRTGFREVRAEMKQLRSEVRAEIEQDGDELGDEISSLRAEMRTGFKRVDGEIGGRREAVTHYHSAVLGHGILISELDDRVRRIVQHLDLPTIG